MSILSGHKLITQNLLSESEINNLIQASGYPQSTPEPSVFNASKHGEFLSSAIGSGSDFAELRSYSYGDDPRRIDWRATARSSTPLVRTFHSELSRPLCILIDRTDSMRYASRVRLKAAQALRMALFTGAREARNQRELSFIILDTKSHWLPEQQGLISLKKMLRQANRPCPPLISQQINNTVHQNYPVNWTQILAGIKQHIPAGSELMLLSDFNSLTQEQTKSLRDLAQYCHCRAVHVFDPLEQNPDFPAGTELLWLNKSFNFSANKQSKEQLKTLLANRFDTLSQFFYKAGINYTRLSVEQQNMSALKGEL